MFFSSDYSWQLVVVWNKFWFYEKSVLCWRGSLVSPGRDKEELEENLWQSVLTNLPPIYSEEGGDLYLVTVFHFKVNLIFSCYLVILIIFRVWGFAGHPSAMKRLRMISLWSEVAPDLTQKEEWETWKRIHRPKKGIRDTETAIRKKRLTQLF